MNKLPLEDVKKRAELIGQGLTDKEIADILFVSPKTVWAWRHRYGIPKPKRGSKRGNKRNNQHN